MNAKAMALLPVIFLATAVSANGEPGLIRGMNATTTSSSRSISTVPIIRSIEPRGLIPIIRSIPSIGLTRIIPPIL